MICNLSYSPPLWLVGACWALVGGYVNKQQAINKCGNEAV